MDRPTRVLSSPLSYKLEKRPSPATGYIRLASFTSRAQQVCPELIELPNYQRFQTILCLILHFTSYYSSLAGDLTPLMD